MADFDARPLLALNQAEADGNNLAAYRRGFHRSFANRPQAAPVVPVDFQFPGIAVHDQQFAHAEALIERDLAPSFVAGTDDFNEEVGRANPVRSSILGLSLVQEHGDVWGAVILL